MRKVHVVPRRGKPTHVCVVGDKQRRRETKHSERQNKSQQLSTKLRLLSPATNLNVSLAGHRARSARQPPGAKSIANMHSLCGARDEALPLPLAPESLPSLPHTAEMLPTRSKHVSTNEPSKVGWCS